MQTVESREEPYRDYIWRVSRKDGDSRINYREFGDIVIHIIDGEYDSDRGGHIIYTERHDSEERDDLNWYEERAKGLIDQLQDDDNIQQCDACDCLYNRKVGVELYEQDLSWSDRHFFKHGLDPRYKAASTNENAETCVWTTGRIFDTVHVVTHLYDTNPFFDDEELVECESLVMTRGFDRSFPDEETRPFEEIHEKYMDIKRKTPRGRSSREKRKEMLELLDWVLKREDRFYTDSRFKPRHQR